VAAKPDWLVAAVATVRPTLHYDVGYLTMLIGIVGTTVAPWMQFYLQSAVVEKGVDARQYAASRVEVIVGCIFTDVIAFFIIVACAATLYLTGRRDITDAAGAAMALRPLAGKYASILFALGLFNASVFAASILPLATAYSVCEGLGVEAGVNKRFREAPVFYWLYTLLIVVGASLILLPRVPLILVSYFSQVANGVLLPFVLIFMLLLINRKDLMGKFTNSQSFNIISIATVVILISLTIVWGLLSI
jgi:Mn2+/Fe2+ NRAMP family transporter